MYYDGKGCLRSAGEMYYDGKGNLRSVGEMYHDYYKSDTIRIISVLITFFVAVPLLAILFGATGFIVSLFTDGNISREFSMWIISSIVLLYVVTGGLKATVSVGVVQSWLFVFTTILLGIITYFNPVRYSVLLLFL